MDFGAVLKDPKRGESVKEVLAKARAKTAHKCPVCDEAVKKSSIYSHIKSKHPDAVHLLKDHDSGTESESEREEIAVVTKKPKMTRAEYNAERAKYSNKTLRALYKRRN